MISVPPRRKETPGVTQDINVLALVKGEERYIFLFDDDRKTEGLRTLGRFASNPELSFSWYDAAVLSQRIRQTAAAAENGSRRGRRKRKPNERRRHWKATHRNSDRDRRFKRCRDLGGPAADEPRLDLRNDECVPPLIASSAFCRSNATRPS